MAAAKPKTSKKPMMPAKMGGKMAMPFGKKPMGAKPGMCPKCGKPMSQCKC